MTTIELPRIETPMADATPRRAVIYCRISDDREGKRWGVDRQERECRKRAAELGWQVIEVLIENDISAYSGKKRPKYQRLIYLLTNGIANAVLALTPKRIYRRIKEAFPFLDLVQERDIAVETIKAGRYNLNTADGRKEARRAAVDAQAESEEIGERVHDAKMDNVREGTFRGGPRPFGFEADGTTPRSLQCPSCGSTTGFTVNRECEGCGEQAINVPGSEAWHVDHAIDLLLAGDSLRSVARYWAAEGITSPPRRRRNPDGTRTDPIACKVTPVGVSRIVLRPRTAGLMEFKGAVVGRAAWPGLTALEKWQAVVALLKSPDRLKNKGRNTAREWLGTGLYRCWCGQPMGSGTTGVGGRGRAAMLAERQARETGQPVKIKTSMQAYRCRTGNHVTRRRTELDEYVQALVVERLSRPDAAQLLSPVEDAGPTTAELAGEANALRAKLDGYAEDYDADLITRKQMIDGTRRVRERLAVIEAHMASLMDAPVLASLPLGTEEIATQWATYHLDKQRAIIDALMTVTVQKARGGRPKGWKRGDGLTYFDYDAIKIEWKHGS